jgi:peptide/nickel transport system ATP-binding protein
MSAPELPAGLLVVRGLTVAYPGAMAPALQDCALSLGPGETVAVVGASGSGKTTLARALLGLLPAGAARSGQVLWRGTEMTGEAAWRRVRGREIGLVLQDPQMALNPVLRVGDQVAAPLRRHGALSRREAWARAVALLAEVRLENPAVLARRHPHELSGGMRQRVGIAAALAGAPSLLVADEPTSSLDLAAERDILLLLRDLQRSRGLALVFVTHDLALVPVVASRVLVLEHGRCVEQGSAADVLAAPAHPATRALLVDPPPAAPPRAAAPLLLSARGLTVRRTAGGQSRDVVRGCDLDLREGELVGLAGASGCGKTTLARALAGHLPYSGTLVLPRGGQRRAVQLAFQDPAAALDPRQSVLAAVAEAAAVTGLSAGAARAAAYQLFEEVGLAADRADRLPHELSGGQQRRVVLARALAADPAVLIADEPTSSVDPPTRTRLLALLAALRARRGLAILLISHDLPLLRRSCQRVVVMAGGVVTEVWSGPGDPGQGDWRHSLPSLAEAAPDRLPRGRKGDSNEPRSRD